MAACEAREAENDRRGERFALECGMTDAAEKKPSTAVALRAGGAISAIVPQSIEEVYRVANCIAASGLAPAGMKTAEQVTVAILTGMEVGLPPMFAIQKIAVINGRPSIWGDAVPALLWSRGFKLLEWSVDEVAHCEVTRPDGTVIERSFSVAQAKKANLWGKAGPWAQYPDRMLQMRARGLACRDGAPDVLSGLYLAEEVQEARDITPDAEMTALEAPKRKSSSAAKKDGTSELFEAIKAKVREATGQRDLLIAIRQEHDADWAQMPARWVEILDNEYEDALLSCRDAAE